MSRSAHQVPVLDRRAHGEDQEKGAVIRENAGTEHKCRHLADSAPKRSQTIPKLCLILIATFLP